MKLKTAELAGLALDWALAVALGAENVMYQEATGTVDVKFGIMDWPHTFTHTDPATCMGLMSEHKMDVTWGCSSKCYVQPSGNADFAWVGGETLVEAVARCVVAMRLGDEVDVPDELCGVMG